MTTTTDSSRSARRTGDGRADDELHAAARRVVPAPVGDAREWLRAAGVDDRRHAARLPLSAVADDLLDGAHDDASRDGWVTLLPASVANGVPGWVTQAVDATPAPVELPPAEIDADADAATTLPLAATPAWLLAHRPHGVTVSWHARVRWGQRVAVAAAPGRAVAAAFRRAVIDAGGHVDGDDPATVSLPASVRDARDTDSDTHTVTDPATGARLAGAVDADGRPCVTTVLGVPHGDDDPASHVAADADSPRTLLALRR